MKTRRIDIESEHGTAVLLRDDGRKQYVAVDITTPRSPYFYVVSADDPDDRQRIARRVHELLEGFAGCQGRHRPYALAIDLIASC